MPFLQNSTDLVSTHLIFVNNPVVTNSTGAAASTSQGATNYWALNTGEIFECFNTTSVNSASPILSATSGEGLNLNQVVGKNSSGIELTQGIVASSKLAKVIGTSPAFYVQATFNASVVLDIANLFVGFRIATPYQTTLTGYSDFCTLGMVTSGEIETKTQKGSAGQVTTDTTQGITGGTNFSVKVLVDGVGNVTYQLSGSSSIVTVPYAFTSGLTVVPFIWYSTSGIGNSETDFISFQCTAQ